MYKRRPFVAESLVWSFSVTGFEFSQVPADLQNEVLMSVQETDHDVVDYLLRRKASQYS